MLQDYEVNHDYQVRPRRTFVVLVLIFGLCGGAYAERAGVLDWLPGGEQHPAGFKPFWEAWHLVREHYVDQSAVKPEAMTQGAINGMLGSLGDFGHTTYVSKKEFQNLEDGLKGQLEGIGAYMGLRNSRPTITQTIRSSPARAAGLKPGDVVIQVDDTDATPLTMNEIIDHVRGPAGTHVRLKVMRPGAAAPLDFDIVRAHVEVPDVSWQILPGTDIAQISMINFGNQADQQLRDAVEAARKKGAKKLIIDIRQNRGGLKEQAVDVTSEFLNKGLVFIEQNGNGERKEIPVKEGGTVTDFPMCVLIDEGTASSAEIFAGAIQDYNRAKLVGSKTFGTGTVLQPFKLSDGGAVLLAVAEWLTPKGRRIWHNGIDPDVPVALPENASIVVPDADVVLDAEGLAKSTDLQLLEAIKLMEGKSNADHKEASVKKK